MENHDNKTSVWHIFITFLVLGLTSFGGPIAHIGYFHQAFIKQKKWLSEDEFSQILALCQFIPGPASSQLGFAIGYAKGGIGGAFAAFIGFTLPSVLALVAFVSVLPLLATDTGNTLVHGLKLVAVIVVSDAVIGMATKLCPDIQRKVIALLAGVILLSVSSTYIQLALVLFGALVGIWACKSAVETDDKGLNLAVPMGAAKWCFLIFSLLLIFALVPFDNPVSQALASLYQAGALVFGGGHVVLPYLEQAFVSQGLVDKETFLAGYGATQAVPGPLFTFASYLSAVTPTDLPVWLMVAIGTLAVFAPGFLLLFAVLPIWQKVASNIKARAALAGVNAAVVGILAACLYDPIITSSILSWQDLVIAAVGLGVLKIWQKPPLWVVIWALAASFVLTF